MRSMWFLAKSGRPETTWLRENDGTFTEMMQPAEHPGFFGDALYLCRSLGRLSVIRLAGSRPYGEDAWAPGVGPGLYEFVGTGNTGLPNRVDVDNDGDPISDCLVGSHSSTGSAVFNAFTRTERPSAFTVGECEGKPDQIWARVDESKSYFASESQCTRNAGDPGGVCNAPCQASSSKDPCLESPDGSSIVFSTNQQLLNSDTDQTTDLYEYVLPTASDPNPSPNLIPGVGGGTQRQSAEHGARLKRRPQGLLHGEGRSGFEP